MPAEFTASEVVGQFDLQDAKVPMRMSEPIAAYLKGPAGGRGAEPNVTPPPPAQLAEGKRNSIDGACIACHENDGLGRAADPVRRCPATPVCNPPDALSTPRIIPATARKPVTTPRAPSKGIDAGLCRQDDRPGNRRRDELHAQRLPGAMRRRW